VVEKRAALELRKSKGRLDDLKAEGKEYIVWDAGLKGFGIKVLPSGQKTFIVKGRVHNKQIEVKIGRYPIKTPDQAWRDAAVILGQMADGTDPRALKRETAAMVTTLREIAMRYVTERNLKDTSRNTILRHIDKTFAAWADKPIVSIKRAMVSARFEEYKVGGHDGKNPAPVQANQAFQCLKAIFNFAMRELRTIDDEPIIRENPVGVLHGKWAPVRARTRRIATDKLGEVWQMLIDSRKLPLNAETISGIELTMLLLLTGCRLSELTTLKWEQVTLNGDKSSIYLPDPKGGSPIWLPLSNQAQQLLAGRVRRNSTDFVFPSWSKVGHIIDPRDTLNKISAICGHRISAHDLRRTYTTIGIASLKLQHVYVELLTGHKPTSVTSKHYLETQRLEYLYPETQQIADFIVGCAVRLPKAA